MLPHHSRKQQGIIWAPGNPQAGTPQAQKGGPCELWGPPRASRHPSLPKEKETALCL